MMMMRWFIRGCVLGAFALGALAGHQAVLPSPLAPCAPPVCAGPGAGMTDTPTPQTAEQTPIRCPEIPCEEPTAPPK